MKTDVTLILNAVYFPNMRPQKLADLNQGRGEEAFLVVPANIRPNLAADIWEANTMEGATARVGRNYFIRDELTR